jgi:hypothetical protein
MNIAQAVKSLQPDTEFIIENEDYSTIKWIVVPDTIPTQAEVDVEVIRLQAEYDAQEYARNRQPEYPEIGDQLDALYHAGVFPANMAARIKETKDKYPK